MDPDFENGTEVNVRDLQSALFPVNSAPKLSSSDTGFLSNFLLKPNQSDSQNDQNDNENEENYIRSKSDSKESMLKDSYCASQAARWPTECQVLEERVTHISYNPPSPEPYYVATGKEVQPKTVGEESGVVVFQHYPISAVNYFTRSSVGGSKYLLNTNPTPDEQSLQFESRFESGNLAKVVKITANYYELYIRTDLYTNRHVQWFYFRVSNMQKNMMYRFSIVNLSKCESLYGEGMKPLMYSTKDAQLHSVGWRRFGDNISYYANENTNEEDADTSATYTLTFTVEFPHDQDYVYIAHSYPYTYTDLQDYLLQLINHPVKSTYTSVRLLCKTLAGNNVYFVTITSPPPTYGERDTAKKKRAIVITGRVHPGESPSSWMMKGFLDFLTSDTGPARDLRENFIFKLVPMLNPDGVIVGNNRCSLTGKDLNRQYRTVIRETYPSIWYTKLMVRRLLEECGVAMYCDLHAHSRKHNIFIYGCENRRGMEKTLHEQVFPLLLHKNTADKFSFEDCKFKIQKIKEGTGRVVMWMMGISNSYTMEASFAGSRLGARADTHFSTLDYELMGKSFCQTLLDFYDENPRKERLRLKIINRLVKEGSNADEPTNIPLSDFSSDEGDTSSSDEASRQDYPTAVLVPPPSPVIPKRKKKAQATMTQNVNGAGAKQCPSKSPILQRISFPANIDFPMMTTALSNNNSSNSKSGYTSDTSVYTDSEEVERAAAGVVVKKQLKKKKNLKLKKTTKIFGKYQEYADVGLGKERCVSLTSRTIEVDTEVLYNGGGGSNVKRCSRTLKKSRYVYSHKKSMTTIAEQLAEVQTRLKSLRNRLWMGVDNLEDGLPLSWDEANFCHPAPTASSHSKRSFKTDSKSRKEKPHKKEKEALLLKEPAKDNKEDPKKDKVKKTSSGTKKLKTKSSNDEKEAKGQTIKKNFLSGLKRQTAVDLEPALEYLPNVKRSKSLIHSQKKKLLKIKGTVSCDEGGDDGRTMAAKLAGSKSNTKVSAAKIAANNKQEKKRSKSKIEKTARVVENAQTFVKNCKSKI